MDDPGQLPGRFSASAFQPHAEDCYKARLGICEEVSHVRFAFHTVSEKQGLDLLFPEELIPIFQCGVAALSQVGLVKVPVLTNVRDQRLQRVAGLSSRFRKLPWLPTVWNSPFWISFSVFSIRLGISR